MKFYFSRDRTRLVAYHRVVHALPDLHDSDIALVISPLEHRPLPLIDPVVDQCGDHAALGVVLRGTHGADLDLAAGLLVVGHHVDRAHEAVRLPHGELRNDMGGCNQLGSQERL